MLMHGSKLLKIWLAMYTLLQIEIDSAYNGYGWILHLSLDQSASAYLRQCCFKLLIE